MPHCDSFYRALDRMLEKKMTIDEIAIDLCSKTKDPRRNMILDIKEHKGEDWLIANAEWLGYDLGHAFAGRQTQEQAKRAAIRCSNDLLRSKETVSDTSPSIASETTVVPEATISDKVVKEFSSPEIKLKDKENNISIIDIYPPKIEASPIVEIIEAEKLETNIRSINKTFQPIQIQKSVQPRIIGDVCNEGKCSIGKIIPDCNICKFGAYKENEWYCSKWFYVCEDSCRFENRENQGCKICGFTTNIKEIFLEHAKLHKDEDIIQQAMQKIRHDDFLKDDVEMCPCGCGYGRGKTRWYSKIEGEYRWRKRISKKD